MIQDPHSVIQTIRLSEKATRLGEENNEYVFIVTNCRSRQLLKSTSARKWLVCAPQPSMAKLVANAALMQAARIITRRPSFVSRTASVSTLCNLLTPVQNP